MIDPIAKLHSPNGTLLSIFVNRRAPATRAVLVDLLKAIRSEERQDRAAEKSIRFDCDRIIDSAARIDTETAPAVALFASHDDGIFEYLPLSATVEDTAVVGPRPLLRPLRAQPRPMRVGVIIADGARARTYVFAGGDLHDLGDELEVDPGKDNYAGFAGYEEHRIRSRADELANKLWRQAGRRLLDVHQDQALELVVIGSHEEFFDLIAAQMHAYLQDLPQGRIVVDPHTLTHAELSDMISGEIDRARVAYEERLLERVIGEVDAGGQAVAGLAPLLEAANAHAIDHMVVAGPYAKPGVQCDQCGWLGRTGTSCPVCGSPLFDVADVVAAAMEATVEAGGRVTIVSVASRLDAQGVAALTRFSIA